jgi:hypothetical protein
LELVSALEILVTSSTVCRRHARVWVPSCYLLQDVLVHDARGGFEMLKYALMSAEDKQSGPLARDSAEFAN